MKSSKNWNVKLERCNFEKFTLEKCKFERFTFGMWAFLKGTFKNFTYKEIILIKIKFKDRKYKFLKENSFVIILNWITKNGHSIRFRASTTCDLE